MVFSCSVVVVVFVAFMVFMFMFVFVFLGGVVVIYFPVVFVFYTPVASHCAAATEDVG